MHKSSKLRMKWFVDHYICGEEGKRVLDVGSYDVNGTYKELFEGMNIQYIGLDIEKGPNVDVVMDQVYSWDVLEDESFDYIISGQAFEHIEFPWLTIQQVYKKLKVGGVVCIIAPNSAPEHRYPYDCYRYFSDGLAALAKWAGFTVLDVSVAGIPEKGASSQWDSIDNDVCLIAMKGSEELLGREIVKFPYERRYSRFDDLLLSYDFMYKWINLDNKQQVLQRVITKHNAKTVYIYGYGEIGKLLHKELDKIRNIEVVIWNNKESYIPCERNSLLIITILDYYRNIKFSLDDAWKGIPKYYLDDLFILDKASEYFKENKELYLYGAGVRGKRLAQCLTEYGLKPCGFVVSNGKRKEESCNNIKVFELQELKEAENIGVIIAVRDDLKDELVSNLINEGIHHYLSL